MGPRSQVEFGPEGGSLGRSLDNDWVLQDSSRFVSSRHARIEQRDGSWYLEDVSTNGTFLNDAPAPLPRQTPCELHNGDLLRIGEYVVAVTIDGDAGVRTATARVPAAEADLALLEGSRDTGTGTGNLAPQVVGHLGAALDPSALFGQRDALGAAIGGNALDSSGGLAVGSAFGRAVVVPFSGAKAAVAEAGPAPEDSDIVAARRLERLQRALAEREGGAAHGVAAHATAHAGADSRPGLEALCRGAGIDPTLLQGDSAAAMLQLAGQLLREMIVGLKEIDLERRSQLRRMGVGPPAADARQASFDLGAPADELLMQMLASHESRRLDAAQWTRQAMQGIKRHEAQVEAGLRAALTQLLGQLEPRDLEARFERSASRNLMGGRPANWELYRDFFRSLCEAGALADGIPHTFAEGFAAGYQKAGEDERRG
jgi:type VI secretion system FHA domain protein